ncbi:NEDD8-activating enzyme E1 catalytic subunit, putative, partial [Entamoeba invadens IP1]
MTRQFTQIKEFLGRTGGSIEDPPNVDYENFRILVVGAGGLGCEVLKSLAMVGFRDITVIDMDTIEYSNLNRQFLFRRKDVGRPKSEVAAEFVMRRVPGCHISHIVGRLEDQPESFYKSFKLVISGLDNLGARRWTNSMLCSLVKTENGEVDPSTVIPLIDGGTEGFQGHVMVIVPGIAACLECQVSLFPPAKTFPMCTIAAQPRLPEHCIAWASQIAWDNATINKAFPLGTKVDADNPDHVKWIYEKALERAQEKNISGVTYKLTLGVIKNILPAIASTNSLIAAQTANEAFKYATGAANNLENYVNYFARDGINTTVENLQRRPECFACGTKSVDLVLPLHTTLQDLVDRLTDNPQIQ